MLTYLVNIADVDQLDHLALMDQVIESSIDAFVKEPHDGFTRDKFHALVDLRDALSDALHARIASARQCPHCRNQVVWHGPCAECSDYICRYQHALKEQGRDAQVGEARPFQEYMDELADVEIPF